VLANGFEKWVDGDGPFDRRWRRYGGSFRRSGRERAASDSRLRGGPLIIRLQSPAWWNERRACLRECDAFLHEQILLPGCSQISPVVYPGARARELFFRA
jgi:hypothetical protein